MSHVMRLVVLFVPLTFCSSLKAQEVDLLTGRLNMSLPIGSLQANDLSVPISIYQHGGSMRVAEGEGKCGVGWGLSAGGGVYREVRGLPDEINTAYRKGWLYNYGVNGSAVQNFVPTADDNLATASDEYADYAALQNIVQNYVNDTEPDLFSVSAPGLSLQFVFEPSGTPRLLTYADVQIEVLPNVMTMTSFRITTNQGLVYVFGGDAVQNRDMILRRGTTGDTKEMNTYAKYIPKEIMITSVGFCFNWKLASITSPTSGTAATFSYKPNSSDLPDGASKTIFDLDSSNYILDLYKTYELQTIRLKGFKATFSWGNNLLRSVTILDTVTGDNRRAELRYLTATTNYATPKAVSKQFLDKVVFGGTNCERGEAYRFEYEGIYGESANFTVIGLDWKRNWSQDYYGYRNAAANNRNKPTLYFANSENDGQRLRVHQIAGVSSTTLAGHDRSVSSAVSFGALRKVTYPSGGYTEIRYEPNTYLDQSVVPNVTYNGPGARVTHLLSQGGDVAYAREITDYNDSRLIEKQYQYVLLAGGTSGKLTSPPKLGYITRDSIERVVNNLGEEPVVMYSRVVEKIPTKGYTVYEYNIPGVFPETLNGLWKATKHRIARSSSVSAGNLKNGYYLFPYAPSTNYAFRRGQLTRVASYSEANTMLSEKLITYTGISVNPTTIKGLRFEILDGVYYYGIYEILTGRADFVQQEVVKQVSLEDQVRFLQTTTTYAYNSNQLLNTVTTTFPNSTTSVRTLKYAKDFPFSSPPATDTAAVAIKVLNQTSRGSSLVEEYTTLTVPGSSAATTSAQLIVYRDLGNNLAMPYYIKALPSGLSFSPATMSGQSFVSSTNYRVARKILDYEEGRVLTQLDDNKNTQSTHYEQHSTLPVANFLNARAQQSVFEGFENSYSYGLTPSVTGLISNSAWTGDHALTFTSNSQSATSSATKQVPVVAGKLRVSCWAKGDSTRAVTFTLIGTGAPSPLTLPITRNNKWIYLEGEFAVSGGTGPFRLEVKSNATSASTVTIDDVLLTPSIAQSSSQTALAFKGVTSSTDDRGFSTKITYDHLGRPVNTLDRKRNLVERKEYSSKNSITPTAHATFTSDPLQVGTQEPVVFTPVIKGVTNCDPNLTYSWAIDGVAVTAGAGGVLTYTFQTPGIHNVTFTATSLLYGTTTFTETYCVNFKNAITLTTTVTNASGQPAGLTVDCNSGIRNLNLVLPSAPVGCVYQIYWTKNGSLVGTGTTLTVTPISLSTGNPIYETYDVTISLECSGVNDCIYTDVIAYNGNTSFMVTHVPNGNCQ